MDGKRKLRRIVNTQYFIDLLGTLGCFLEVGIKKCFVVDVGIADKPTVTLLFGPAPSSRTSGTELSGLCETASTL